MKTILIATDFSDAARNATIYGVELAKALNARVVLLNVYPYVFPLPDAVMVTDADLQDASKESLLEEVKSLGVDEQVEIKIVIVSKQGSATEVIVSVASEVNAAWIVAGMKGYNTIARKMFAGTALTLREQSPVPLILVPLRANFTAPKRIALACDSTQQSNLEVLDPLKEFGITFNSELYIVQVVRHRSNELVERLLRPTALLCHLKQLRPTFDTIVSQDVVPAISKFAKEHEVDVVAMVSPEHSLMERIILKSSTREMISKSDIPLIILPAVSAIKSTETFSATRNVYS